MAIRKEKDRRPTDDLRLELEAAVRKRKSLSQIRREPGIPRSTARREIMNHWEESTRTFYGRRFNPCTHRDGRQAVGMCGRPDCTRNCASCGLRCRRGSCPRFEEEACPRLAAAPYVRNGCPDEVRCRLRRLHYLHRVAHGQYRDTPVTARRGIYATRGEPRAINEVLAPALNRGRSVHHATVSSPDSFGVCERTVYRHVNAGALPVRRHDLPMAVRHKRRSGTPVERRVDRRCAEGRRRELHREYLAGNPGVQVPQVDTSEGGKHDRRVLLTVMFPNLRLMAARLPPGKCARHVTDAFNWMWNALGESSFRAPLPRNPRRQRHGVLQPPRHRDVPGGWVRAHPRILRPPVQGDRQGPGRAEPRVHQARRVQGREPRLTDARTRGHDDVARQRLRTGVTDERQGRQPPRRIPAIPCKSVPPNPMKKRTLPAYRRPCPLTSAIDKTGGPQAGTRQMVLPACRCPSALWRSRVSPACRPAGRARALQIFQAPPSLRPLRPLRLKPPSPFRAFRALRVFRGSANPPPCNRRGEMVQSRHLVRRRAPSSNERRTPPSATRERPAQWIIMRCRRKRMGALPAGRLDGRTG